MTTTPDRQETEDKTTTVSFNGKHQRLHRTLLRSGLTTKAFSTFVQDAYHKEVAALAKAGGITLISEDEVEEYATIRS